MDLDRVKKNDNLQKMLDDLRDIMLNDWACYERARQSLPLDLRRKIARIAYRLIDMTEEKD